MSSTRVNEPDHSIWRGAYDSSNHEAPAPPPMAKRADNFMSPILLIGGVKAPPPPPSFIFEQGRVLHLFALLLSHLTSTSGYDINYASCNCNTLSSPISVLLIQVNTS